MKPLFARALVLSAIALFPLVTSPAAACGEACSAVPWQTPTLLTPEVPADLGPMVLVIRGCKTPEASDVGLTLRGPSGVVAGTPKQIEQLAGFQGVTGPVANRDGRLVMGFLPAAALEVGRTYTLTITVGSVPTEVSFVATEAWGVAVAPALAAPIVVKEVPTRVCCQGKAGCGGAPDADPYPSPAPSLETVPAIPSGERCTTIAITDEPETRLTFPLPPAATKALFDYRLYQADSPEPIAFFSGRRLSQAEHQVRLVAREDRCFRLEVADLLRGAKASTTTCTGPAVIAPKVQTFCADLGEYATCRAENATRIAETCAGPGGGGTAGAAGGPATAPPPTASDEGCSVSSPGASRAGLLGLAAIGVCARRVRRKQVG